MGGTYHLLYGCTGKFITIIDKVVCCDECYRKLLLRNNIGKDGLTTCKNCYSLDTSLMEYEPDENYPKNQLCSPMKTNSSSKESHLNPCLLHVMLVLREYRRKTGPNPCYNHI